MTILSKAVVIILSLGFSFTCLYAHEHKIQVEPVVPIAVQQFGLDQVTLLEGPFQNAMDKNAQWLLNLEPDRFLAWFRKEAGLEPKGRVYPGWESESIAGHSLGHYLTAVSLQYHATGDQRFKERADYIVDQLALCQNAHGDGYVAAIPEGRRIFDEVSRGVIRSAGFDLNGGWVPWYNLDKLFAGLRDAYLYTSNEKALEVLNGLCDWAWETTKDLNEHQWQQMLACEFGAMNATLADIYAITENPRHLELANKFYHNYIMDPLANRQDRLAGQHANTQIPKVIGAARIYELTGREDHKTIADFFWYRVVNYHSYVNAGHSSYEAFGEPGKLNDRMGDTAETCNTYNMLRLTDHLYSWNPRAQYMDFYERAIYNHILASQHPETGMVKYKGFLDMPARKHFSHPTDDWWCCVGTGMENHIQYGKAVYHHSEDSLYVNLFIASELDFAQKGLKVTQQTDFPKSDTSRLVFSAQQPTELTLLIRDPAWCDDMAIAVNGTEFDAPLDQAGYRRIERTFRHGDEIDIHLPMELTIETMPDNHQRIALLHGPIVLAADLQNLSGFEPDPELMERIGQDIHIQTFSRFLQSENVPILVGSHQQLLQQAQPADKPLHYNINQVGRILRDGYWQSGDVYMLPLYEVTDQVYTVYMDTYTQQQWQQRQEEVEAKRQQMRQMQEKTVGAIRIGEMQPERDHNLRGQRTRTGEHHGRRWRDAYDGGWFSFEMPVLPDEKVMLQVTYFGSDGGNRAFGILADGILIGTETLQASRPGEFFDVTYPIPQEITEGKDKVTVRFQALPGNVAGGIFGCRVLRFEQ